MQKFEEAEPVTLLSVIQRINVFITREHVAVTNVRVSKNELFIYFIQGNMQMVGPYILKLKVGPVQMHHLYRGKSATV